MNVGRAGGAASLSLEQLVALNDEMAALVRAGVPLEQGLVEIGGEMSGRLGSLATRIGQRMRQGESLSQILAGDEHQFPPVWRAIVEAGLRSGHLSTALEGLSTTARRVAELRKSICVAWIYPLTVIAIAYAFFVFLVVMLAPRMLDAYRDLTSRTSALLETLVTVGRGADWWGPLVPLAVIGVCTVRWYRSGRASLIQTRAHRILPRGFSLFHWPSVRQALRDGRMATFSEILATLLDHEVPLSQAVVLAADASGDRSLGGVARELSTRLERGEVFVRREELPAAFPPLIGWLLSSGSQPAAMSRALRLTAENYRRRAAQAALWNATYLPLLLTATVGGTVTLLEALAVFIPIARLLYDLG